jgi:hypothetical protein
MSSIAFILETRKKRLSLQREADLLEQQEKGLIQDMINSMVNAGQTLLSQGVDEVQLIETQEPIATSWPLVLDYIIANDAVDLLQKRLTASAVKQRWSNGVVIPGIEATTKLALKFNI